MYRYITGKIYRTNDEAWRNITATFKRCSGSFTSNIIYPPDSNTCEIDESGNLINCKLWVNESGDKISNYDGKVGTYRFQFSIPVGDGSPIDIGTLIAGSLPVESYPQSIIDYVDDAIAVVIAGESKSLYSDNFIANQSLSALRIIDLTNLTYASSDNLSQAFVSLGFVNQAVSIGGNFKTITQGIVSDASWNWQLDKPIFLGLNGFITQIYPINSLFCKIVASVISSQKIFIDFGEPILL